MSELSIKQIAKSLRKMRVNDGDVLLLKTGSPLAEHLQIEGLARALDSVGLHKVVAVVVDEWDDVKTLSEEDMNAVGWYRIESLRGRIVRRAK